MSAFDRGRIKVLVATDIAARGIDVKGISHVINYEMPDDPKSYVHRIGRTARAGSAGTALSLCNAEEVALLGGIEKLTRSPLLTDSDQPFHSAAIASLHVGTSSRRAGVSPPKAKRRFGRGRGAVSRPAYAGARR